MKKSITILILLALVTGGVFAQGINFGYGLLYDGSWNNGTKAGYMGYDFYGGVINNSFGGFLYLDSTYVELDFSISFGLVDITTKVNGYGLDETNQQKLGDAVQFGISLLAKYPFELGRITLFPLVGISYNMFISLVDGRTVYSDPEVLNQFGVLAGIGADFFYSGSLYLRVEGLFQLRFASEYQRDLADYLKAEFASYSIHTDFKTTLGMGPVIKIAFGSKF